MRECIAQGRKFADACQGPDKGRIRKVCDDLDRLMGDLAQLRKLGKVCRKSYKFISMDSYLVTMLKEIFILCMVIKVCSSNPI